MLSEEEALARLGALRGSVCCVLVTFPFLNQVSNHNQNSNTVSSRAAEWLLRNNTDRLGKYFRNIPKIKL